MPKSTRKRTKTTTITSTTKKYISFPFEFKGNEPGCKVALWSPSRGDGEIATGHGGRKYAQVSANLQYKDADTLRLVVTEGPNWQSDRTHLMLRDVVEVSTGLNRRCVIRPNIKTVWESKRFKIIGKKHGWNDVTHLLLDCPFIKTSERDRVRIKVDGGGEDRGNIGIEATFLVPYAYYKDEEGLFPCQ